MRQQRRVGSASLENWRWPFGGPHALPALSARVLPELVFMLDEPARDVFQPTPDVLPDPLLPATAFRTDPLGFGYFMGMNPTFHSSSPNPFSARLLARTALALRLLDLSFELGVFPSLLF
jgi:hypothetical protein